MKILLPIALIIIFLAEVFWLIFYANIVANEPWIINARKKYAHSFWNIQSTVKSPDNVAPPPSATYPITVINGDQQTGFVYGAYGSLAEINKSEGVMWLTNTQNKRFGFNVIPANNTDYFVPVIVMSKSGNKKTYAPANKNSQIRILDDKQDTLVARTKVFVLWKDKRKLSEMTTSSNAMLNTSVEDISLIYKYED